MTETYFKIYIKRWKDAYSVHIHNYPDPTAFPYKINKTVYADILNINGCPIITDKDDSIKALIILKDYLPSVAWEELITFIPTITTLIRQYKIQQLEL